MLVVILLLSNLAYSNEQVYKIRWVLAHEPARIFERSAKHFAKEIELTSKGRIKVEIVSADQLPSKKAISPHDAFNKIKLGEFEMCQTYTTYLGHQNKDFWVLDLPFLFRDHDHASKVLDGPLGQQILAGLKDTGVKGLAFTYSGGYRVIPTATKPIATKNDFKNMRIRIADSPISAAYFKELGAKPIINVSDENAVAARFEGIDTTYSRLPVQKDIKAKYINETEHSLFLTSILMNREFYDKLPADLQNIVKSSILTTAKLEREDSIKDGIEVKLQLQKEGKIIFKLIDTELSQLKVSAEKIHKKFDNYFPKNLIADIKNQ